MNPGQEGSKEAAREISIAAMRPHWGRLAEIRFDIGAVFHESLANTRHLRMSYKTAVAQLVIHLRREDITLPEFDHLVADLARETADLYAAEQEG